MFGLLGAVTLVVFIIARPLDFLPALRGFGFLHIFFALALFGFFVDARWGFIKPRATPQLPWVLASIAIALSTAALLAPDSLAVGAGSLLTVLAVYLVLGQGVQHIKAFEVVAAAVLLSSVWVAAVCAHQGAQPRECVAVAQKDDHRAMGTPDGRRCADVESCYLDPPEPQAVYRCEHAGLLGITSIGDGRVRYLGVLHDPNEVALTASVAIPLAAGLYRRRRSFLRGLLLLATLALAFVTVVWSGSRGGQLVFATVAAVYAMHRYGWRGVFAGAAVAVPVMLLGGREGASAAASASERLDLWYHGLEMVKGSPLLGVGYGQFTEHQHLTAHNSLLLVAAETGLPGAFAWTGVIYISLKIPLRVLREVTAPEAEAARIWALSLLAAIAGAVVGGMFLSFSYHLVLWIYLGLSAALWALVKTHQPSFSLRVGTADVLGTAAVMAGGLAALFLLPRL